MIRYLDPLRIPHPKGPKYLTKGTIGYKGFQISNRNRGFG